MDKSFTVPFVFEYRKDGAVCASTMKKIAGVFVGKMSTYCPVPGKHYDYFISDKDGKEEVFGLEAARLFCWLTVDCEVTSDAMDLYCLLSCDISRVRGDVYTIEATSYEVERM